MFQTYGPFEIRRRGKTVEKAALSEMWNAVCATKSNRNLDGARGVYVFATRRGKVLMPWYVGKTDGHFRIRFNQHLRDGKLDKLAACSPKDELVVFLLARVSAKAGKFRKRSKDKLKSIDRLEFMLIASCLKLNSDLLNTREATFHRSLCVPGYLNDDPTTRHEAAQDFAIMLGTD
jgi:hypothetical protein